MKLRLFITLYAISTSVFAQKPITVLISSQPYMNVSQQTFVVQIPQTTLKNVESHWLKYMSKESKGRVQAANGTFEQPNVSHPNISPNPFTIFSQLMGTTEGVRLTAWFTQNGTDFLFKDPNSGRELAAQKYLHDFAIQEYRAAVQEELATEQNKLQLMEKQLSGLNQDEEKSVKTIQENERATERSNEAIITNKADIQNSSDKISNQKGMVDRTASDPNATKGAKKTLSQMEDEKKELQKRNEAQGKDKYSMSKENRAEERNTSTIQQKQMLKTADIETQRQKVYEVKTKLDNIK
ncbi:MAG: hypothetical protein IPP77_09670 [Bacteroidetes bacterium]|nr:hypothetical protein [Bacteroidota bacterium]